MNESLKTTLIETIEEDICRLHDDYKPGDEGYDVGADSIGKLIDRVIALDEVETRVYELDIKDNEVGVKAKEVEVNSNRADDDKRDRLIKNALNIVSTVGGFALVIWGTLYTTAYEKEDIVSSTAGRAFFSRIFPKK